MMRLLLLALFAVVVPAQDLLPLWTGGGYRWVALGPSFRVVNNTLEVILPPGTNSKRIYNTMLVPVNSVCPLPVGALNVVVHVRGTRVFPGRDYRIEAGAIVPLRDWWATSINGVLLTQLEGVVVIDYDAAK